MVPSIDSIPFIRRINLEIIAGLSLIVPFVLIIAVITGQIDGESASSIGTLFLASVTVVSVLLNYRQSRYMREDLKFRRRPRISIYHDPDEKLGLITFENTGEVPERVTLHFSLKAHRFTEENSPILNQNIVYEDIPKESKVFRGGAGDWQEKDLFLEPKEKKQYLTGLLQRELNARDQDLHDGEFLWFRIDAELYSEVGNNKPRKIQRLFHVSLDDSTVFSPTSFLDARRNVAE